MANIHQVVATLTARADEIVEWSPLRFRVRTYLTATLPPLDLVTSVRAVVRHDDQILVVRDPASIHILPGGRREADETLLQTLQREVREETGWTIKDAHLLGLVHFQHITPQPADYRYPYPDFLHIIYAATADRYDQQHRETDGYELDATLLPIATVTALSLSQGERAFLTATLQTP